MDNGQRRSPYLQQQPYSSQEYTASTGHLQQDNTDTMIRPIPSPQHLSSRGHTPTLDATHSPASSSSHGESMPPQRQDEVVRGGYNASPESNLQPLPSANYALFSTTTSEASHAAVLSPAANSASAPPSTSASPPPPPAPPLAGIASTSSVAANVPFLESRQQSTSSVVSVGSSALGPGTGNGAGVGASPSPSGAGAASSSSASGHGMSSNGQTGLSTANGLAEVVPVNFDEGVLRALCDLDCALPLITERIKQGISSCKQVATFFRSRAELEEKYARSLSELVRVSGESYGRSYCKAGTFVDAYHAALRVHDTVAQNRVRFAQRLTEMSDELLALAREGERLRKLHKENGLRYERNVQESEMMMEKAKTRFDNTAEELERILVAKEGESLKDSGMHGSPSNAGGPGQPKEKRSLGKAMKGGMLFKGKGPAQMQRQEDEVRGRMSMASEVFRKAVSDSQAVRQEYFGLQLPKILRLLKECSDEIDLGTQYHLARYAFLYEATILGDGAAIAPMGPEDGPGLKAIVESIDSRSDFKTFMQNFAVARGSGRGPRREGPYEDGFTPSLPPHVLASQQAQQAAQNTPAPSSSGHAAEVTSMQSMPGSYSPTPVSSTATFGVELGAQMVRDGTEIPKVVEKCAEAIEMFGLESKGIYRLSGTTSKVQKLKAALDKDVDAVDLTSEEWTSDINVVASALKQWFRELPEPLLTHALYQGFIDAARNENDRLRHIRLHEQVNELPDPNYATLKYFMGHLDKIRRSEHINHMGAGNLAVVMGPTLLGAPPSMGALNLQHMAYQCKAIETILERYREIFVEESEE